MSPTSPPEAPKRVRVLIVDDQPLLRAGFRMLINSQRDLRVVGEAGDGNEAVRVADECAATGSRPDVILMDVRMPRCDGLEATRVLMRHQPRVRVVVLTTFDLDEYALEALRVGASGFLLKDVRPEELLAAIRTVARGDAVIAPSTTRRLLSHLVASAPPPRGSVEQDSRLTSLTGREREVFELVGRGLSNAEITAQLVLSEATVKTHVSHILGKLQLRDRVQAVVLAYESGVVIPGDV